MSTKTQIKHAYDATGQGFYLYEDWLDECSGSDVVHLRLDGVSFEATVNDAGRSVTVTIPRDMARQLGLIPPIDS